LSAIILAARPSVSSGGIEIIAIQHVNIAVVMLLAIRNAMRVKSKLLQAP